MNQLEKNLLLPRINVIVGSIGEGKSALAFWILEKIHKIDPNRKMFVYCSDESKNSILQNILPSYVIVTNESQLFNIPNYSFYLGDEGTIWANSKDFKKGKEAIAISRSNALIRQRDQILLILTQSMALINVDFFRFGFNMMLKYIDELSVLFEREQISFMIEEIMTEFKDVVFENNLNRKQLFYFMNSNYSHFHINCLPSFWSENLSTVWGSEN